MRSFQSVLRNLGSSAAARLLSAGFGLLLIIYMARAWAPERFGEYIIAFNYFQLLQQAPLLGLHFLLARDAAGQPARQSRDLVTAGALALAASVPLAAGVWLLGALLYPAGLQPLFLLVGLALIPTAAILVIEMVLTGQERLGRVAQVNITESVLRCLVFGVMVQQGLPPVALMAAFFGLRCVSLALYLWDGRLRALIDLRAFDWSTLAGFLRQAPVLFAILLLSAAFSRFDVTFLSKLVPAGEVAVYSIAARLYDLALMVPSILITVLLPIVARLHAKRAGSVQALYDLGLRYGLVVGLPGAVVAGYLSAPVIPLFFGDGFAGAVLPFQVLLLATVVTGANQLMACVLLVFNLQRLDLQCLAAGCAALVVLLAGFIPILGMTGAALAALCGALVQCVARALLMRRHAGVHSRAAQVAGPLAAAAVMAAMLFGLPAGPLIQLPLALLGYASTTWVVRSVHRGDLHAARSLLAPEAV